MVKVRIMSWYRCFQVMLLLSLGLLANTGCGQVKHLAEDMGMANNNYATAEFGWSMGVSGYSLDLKAGESMQAIRPGNNMMLDSEGNEVAGVDFATGGRWGLNGNVLGSQDDSKRHRQINFSCLRKS